ncbi:DNA polymerase alpha catalytic [Grosmannia clavigera kw1407]|uniref:DNA polymerase n=1 Tax=Grosmannia clavigera (strain kw1407 / UAMH 11150) TaxID=655863 RepID=F0XGC8_GROCL|nr:DNA polymerase alpha catalytic [Grosmannia clavigera kw1407]EFX03107.1 DNA polymerase alpha catalytic [Grosmannia clavigera kw1407]
MSKVAGRRSKFEELRALRKAGKKAFDSYEVEDADKLYELVDDDQYKNIVRSRLNQDDFVVDDNGEGYADDGREEWDRAHVYESDSDDNMVARTKDRKSSKKSREEDQAKRDANDRNIAEYFTKGAAKPQAKTKVVVTKDDDSFMASLLDEVDTNLPTALPVIKKKKRTVDQRKSRDFSPPAGIRQPLPKRAKVELPPAPANISFADDDDDDDFAALHDENIPASDDIPMSDPMPSSPTVQVARRKAQPAQAVAEQITTIKEEEDEDDGMMEVAHAGAVTAASVNLSAARPLKKLVKEELFLSPTKAAVAEDKVDASAWNKLNDKLNVMSSPKTAEAESHTMGGKVDYKDAIEQDGSLNFYWTDYTEIHGSLCLFGKVLNKKTKKHVSSFLKIDNIQRKLFFLPRQRRSQDGEETGDEVSMADVYGEVDALMTKMGVPQHKTKPCTRKYAFELPNIPKEGRYLKLLYPYTKPVIAEAGGVTYSHVFGTNTALFEQFVLWKNVMGPCWLKIEDANYSALKNASHCKLEVLVEHPNMVSTLNDADAPEVPPLTMMSMAVRTVYDDKAKRQEVMAISARIYENISLSDTTPAEKLPCRTFTVIRPSSDGFPLGFETLAHDKTRHRGLVRPVRQEAEVLSFFLAQVSSVDPDVIMGHKLEGADYSVLLSRMRTLKTPNWSRLGRFRLNQWPGSLGRGGSDVFAERQVIAGRLLCDLANDAGRSVMFKCQSWTLTEMCSLYLGGDNQRRELDNEVALKTWAKTKEGLLDYVGHLEADTYFIAALGLRVQILPLTKVLTNLAGNSWARTLTGTRAERNEYILLHEFHRNKYICPDKQKFRGRGQGEDDNADGKKKDKYKGGLVFEPERGLYDKFVLVMDFNSLYPSIIQEFNICFTTVERAALSDEGDAVPEVPTEQSQGVLPRLIATLVSRRRQVKSLMKDKTATAEELATWDIKQLALKLTANSMYGCLGYTQSRFYARPLAVLVTYKGREILRSTKELAESMSLQVIYGDTDSVMINANVDNVADAMRVGQEFKRTVNERYRLLGGFDIDNVFRRILLQAKKKYAAINMVEVGGKYVEKMEVKGLDMKRREYCALSKEMSTRILNEILSGEETEVSVTRIHAYLREMAAKMRGTSSDETEDNNGTTTTTTTASSIPAAKYIIFTQLGKEPTDYPNAETMPQVQVALRERSQGRKVSKGDVVSYLIATGTSAPTSEPAAKRAYTLADVQRKDSGLTPDVEWYIGKQIFPPVERLCANIVGTSTAQLAENLGLDMRRYAAGGGGQGQHGSNGGMGVNGELMEVHPLESQIPDAVRFRDCARLQLRCRKCKATDQFEGLWSEDGEQTIQAEKAMHVTPAGVACKCGAALSTLSVVAQVEHAVRMATSRYYEGWLVCDDPSCGQRTRQMSVYGTRCLGPKGLARDCLGRMRYEMGERDIYNQLVYYAGLFDVDKARTAVLAAAADKDEQDRVLALAEHNRVRFGNVKAAVERYLDKCGRRWVAMDTLFAKLGFAVPAR